MTKWIIRIILFGFCVFMIAQGGYLISNLKADMKYKQELRKEYINF